MVALVVNFFMPRNATVVDAHFIRLTTWQASPYTYDLASRFSLLNT